ncbi:MAG: HDOD domain-containing protein [Planctomycetota bacterium]
MDALPDVVIGVLGLLEHPDTEPPELEKHLAQDPILVGKLLSLVNTPFHGANREINTIPDAIMMVGFSGLRSLLLASSLAPHIGTDVGGYGHVKKGIWLHSVAVAAAARALARLARRSPREREELFVMGLLHDVGKMVTGEFMADVDIPLEYRDDVTPLERERLGIDHAEVGARIAEQWQLGPALVTHLRQHHHPEDQEHSLSILRLADAIAHEVGVGWEIGKAPHAVFPAADLALLRLEDGWEDTRCEVAETIVVAVESMQGVFG